MKRQLFDFYRRFVPAALKRRIPARLKAAALGMGYALTGYPDLRQWQMRHLYKTGPGRWQGTGIEDPLFSCTLEPVAGAGAGDGSPGQYFAEFGFLGVKLKGQLTDPQAVAAGKVELRLDGRPLRRLGVIPEGNGQARILYTIRRPALAMFPERGRLSLHDARGRPLALDLRYFPPVADARQRPCLALDLGIPFGDGSLFDHLAATGPLDKKGWPRPTAGQLSARQDRMLELYSRVRHVFEQDFGRPLFILYGTLLGQVREGDFIPGDDDFDVGYLSEEHRPAAIKAEAIRLMEGLMARGFIVGLNHLGRPYRVRDARSGVEIHLDNHVVHSRDDGHVWIHPRARLPMALDGFRRVETATMRGTPVLRPAGAEDFLAAHYGPGWRVPDPGYANIMTSPDQHVARELAGLCLTMSEQRALARRLARRGGPGDFVAVALEQPYPIARYAERVGF